MGVVKRTSQRLAAIAPSATLAVDAKAKALQAEGVDVIGFGAGEPDFATPAHIVEAAIEACSDPRNHRYSPAGGLVELKAAIVAKTARDSGLVIEPSQVLVTNGGKHAVYTSFAVLCDPGDEVICPAPYWTTYPEAIALCGGVPVVIDTDDANDFKVTVDQLEEARTPRTKAMLFVSPDNPSGAVYRPDEVEAIGNWAVEHGIWVITDEIYEHLTYGRHEFSSMPVLVPELANQCIVVNGVAKTYAMTGWRLGWMVAPLDAAKAAANLQSHLSSNVSNISQRAALAALTGDQQPVKDMLAAFDRRRQLAVSEMNKVQGVVTPTPKGAFYIYSDVSGLLGKNWGGKQINSSLELCDYALDAAEVAMVPGEAFGPSGYVRLSYALGDDQLVAGIQRLQRLFS